MGGRYPGSKRGIVKHEEMEVPDEIRQQLTWRLEELADKLGYELMPKSLVDSERRTFGVLEEHIRYTETPFQGLRLRTSEFEGVRD